jgi:hypothetical protein
MRHPPLFQIGIILWPVGVMNEGIAPHPVPLPMGEGTVLHAPSAILASLLPGGEGQDEGSEFRSRQNGATAGAYASASEERLLSSRTLVS